MSTVDIKLLRKDGKVRHLLKEGNAFCVTDEEGKYHTDNVYENELVSQAHLNFSLLYYKSIGFVRE